MMVCPKGVKSLAVSTTINPVTAVALVAVKSASVKVIPCVVALGSNNKKVPARAIIAKLPTKRIAGLK